MKCEIHDCEMEWIPSHAQDTDDGNGYVEVGYWFCEECQAEEEEYFTTPETAGTEADWGPWDDPEPDEDDYCPHCGKEYEDFSDYGCPSCDRRVLDA